MSNERLSRNEKPRPGKSLLRLFSKGDRRTVDATHTPEKDPLVPSDSVRDTVSWNDVKGILKVAQKALGSVFPSIATAIARLFDLTGEVETMIAVEMNMKQAQKRLEDSLRRLERPMEVSSLSESSRERLEVTANKLKDLLNSLIDRIQQHEHLSHQALLLRSREDGRDFEEIVRVIEEIWKEFERDTLLGVNAKIDATLEKVDVDETLRKLLRPVEQALVFSGLGKGCMPNTRVSVLQDLSEWSKDPASPSICWLNGMAGTGKSSIAQSFSQSLSEARTLGASFFCSRQGVADQDNALCIIPTIAYRLAEKSVSFKHALHAALKSLGPDRDAHALTVEEQFRAFLDGPSIALTPTNSTNHILVIDALDECHDSDALDALLDVVVELSEQSPFKILLTSRREAWLQGRIATLGTKGHVDVRLDHAYSDSTTTDIRSFIQSKLTDIARKSPLLRSEAVWPTNAQLERLVELSDGLFIFASTVVKYLGGRVVDPDSRLRAILEVKAQRAMGELDAIYHFILTEAFKTLEETEVADLNTCLAAVVCARRALSAIELSELLDLPPQRIQAAFQGLHSVILFPPDKSDPISIFHASFQDYVTDERRSDKAWLIRSQTSHGELGQKCLHLMRKLEFNITQTTSSDVLNDEAPQSSMVSGALSYACLYFVEHLETSALNGDVLEQAASLFQQKFLYWLEVLSALQLASRAPGLLGALQNLLRRTSGRPRNTVQEHSYAQLTFPMSKSHIDTFIEDAIEFVNAFRDPIASNPAHIYISALPFTDRSSLIAQTFRDEFQNTLHVETSTTYRKQSPLLILQAHTRRVNSVSFSPDGSRIVSGGDDGQIRVWDITTGEQVCSAFGDSKDAVRSVAFSADGSRVGAGSDTGDIRIWDIIAGKEVTPAISGHQDRVTSIAFSPDGRLIVSSSEDGTIRAWDVKTRQQGPAFENYKGTRLVSVSFSPDSSRVISRSYENTIRVWDISTGKEVVSASEYLADHVRVVTRRMISGPRSFIERTSRGSRGIPSSYSVKTGKEARPEEAVRRHTIWINSFAFSSDGSQFVMGYYDLTLRIWDTKTGEDLCPALEGHTDMISSVAFSADGSRTASGSDDGTVWVWEVRTNANASHDVDNNRGKAIKWLAISREGTNIHSVSQDGAMHVWDTRTGEELSSVFWEHIARISSRTTFSVDGKQIASVSHCNAIHLWDSSTGKQICSALDHMSQVSSLTFSGDGSRLVSGGENGSVRVWDVEMGKEICSAFHKKKDGSHLRVDAVAFSPDGNSVVSGTYGGTVLVLNVVTGLETYPAVHTDILWVTSVAFSPDGNHIIYGDQSGAICVWDTRTGQEAYAPLKMHFSHVISIALSPDGYRAASGSYDGRTCVWDIGTGKEVYPCYRHTGDVTSIAFAPGGNCILSGYSDGTIRMTDMERTYLKDLKMENSISALPEASGSGGSEPGWDEEASSETTVGSNELIRPYHHWVYSSRNRPLFYVPKEFWAGFLWPRTRLLIGAEPCRVDLSRFVYGEDWVKCYTGPSKSGRQGEC